MVVAGIPKPVFERPKRENLLGVLLDGWTLAVAPPVGLFLCLYVTYHVRGMLTMLTLHLSGFS